MQGGSFLESLQITIEIILPLFLLMAVGYLVRLTGLINETSAYQTNRVIFGVFLPALVFQNIYTIDLENLEDHFSSRILFYLVAGIVLQFLMALCIAFLSESENARRGVILQGMFCSNFVLFGIPICDALFGSAASGPASVLVAVIIPVYYILAVISLELFRGGRPGFFRIMKGIFTNPLIIASIVGILCLVFRISLPRVINTTVSSLASIATPLAFVVLGASFSFRKVRNCIKSLCIALGMKLLFFPALFLLLAVLLGFRGPELAVLLVVFASPVAVSSFTMAQEMGGDEALAGQLVIFSSLLAVGTMFLFIFLLKQFSFF